MSNEATVMQGDERYLYKFVSGEFSSHQLAIQGRGRKSGPD